MAKYRAAVIGLGWMGMLYDLAGRIRDRYDVDDVDRPTPELDLGRRFRHYQHPGNERLPNTYAEALLDRPEVELVAAADRDLKRHAAFQERYGVDRLYTDAEEMLRQERPEVVAVATNVKGRADLTCLAVECGAKGIVTEKPMAHALEEADRMVAACADAGAPLSCGAISTTHPSFAKARELMEGGAIGEVLSMEATIGVQHQNWSYFLDSAPAWVIATGDGQRRESGSDEFRGQGMVVTTDGLAVHFRRGSPPLRITGSSGQLLRETQTGPWRLWKEVETASGAAQVEAPWPDPQFVPPYGAVYSVADVIDCMDGRLDEPKNSGRRVAMALEVEIAMKLSAAQGGVRVDLPLRDRSLGLNYDWFR